MEGHEAVLDRLAANDGRIVISSLSVAELQRGIYKQPLYTAIRRARAEVLLRSIPILPFGADAAAEYGQIIARRGWTRGRDFDRMIAAHALASASVLVTANVADFQDIPDLVWEDWTDPAPK